MWKFEICFIYKANYKFLILYKKDNKMFLNLYDYKCIKCLKFAIIFLYIYIYIFNH